MKRILLLIVMMAFAAGCHHAGLKGSGNRQKQKRDVAAFTSISTDGAFQIEVNSQKTLSLEIEGDDNILPVISTDVSGSVLHIKNTRSYSASEPIVLTITIPNLEGVSINGAGSVEVKGLKNEKFEIDVNGAPTILASGETNLLDINTNGAGKIDTHKLRALRAVVESNGISKVAVRALNELDVTVSGPSRVTYEGDPVVRKTVNGPGSVEKKASEGS